MKKEQIKAQLDGYLSQGKVNKVLPTTVQIIDLKIHMGNHTSLSTDFVYFFEILKEKLLFKVILQNTCILIKLLRQGTNFLWVILIFVIE